LAILSNIDKRKQTQLEHPDEIYMKEVQNGRLEAMAVLFERYQTPMYNYFLKLSFDASQSEDLTQQLFIRALQYRNSFCPEQGRVKTWLYRMAVNLHIDHRKQQAKRRMLVVPLDDVHAAVSETTAGNFTEADYSILDKSLIQLEPEQRNLILLCRYQGLKYEEVAAILGMSVANVKVKMHRAILALRKLYFKSNGTHEL
jgi:RNA polymerase sigma factor (sigma-70 family)